jgi:hypothetical protein
METSGAKAFKVQDNENWKITNIENPKARL